MLKLFLSWCVLIEEGYRESSVLFFFKVLIASRRGEGQSEEWAEPQSSDQCALLMRIPFSLLMDVEYGDNSGIVCLIIAESIVSAAESWKAHVSASIRIKSDDGCSGENGMWKWRREWQRERGKSDWMAGMEKSFNIFEIHMYLCQPCMNVFMFFCALQGTFILFF